MPKLDTYGSA